MARQLRQSHSVGQIPERWGGRRARWVYGGGHKCCGCAGGGVSGQYGSGEHRH